MRKIIFLLTLLLLLTFTSLLSAAPNNNGIATAKKLFTVMNLSENYKDTIKKGVEFQIRANPQLAPFRNVMLKFFSKYMGWDSIKDDLAKLYSDSFTVDEMNKLIKFYKTPVGQKAIKLIPSLYEKGGMIGQKKIQAHISELQQMIAEEAKKLQKNHKK